jgi:imidazoleglycerol phosphate synthase glutamine amidotransferase subunit HisH
MQKIGPKIQLVQMYTNHTAAINKKYEYLLHSYFIPVHQKQLQVHGSKFSCAIVYTENYTIQWIVN